MNNILKEFKNFAMRGKVVDLAVGVVIGNTFSKVISSVVSDVIMPLLSFIFGNINFKDYKLTLGNSDISVSIGNFVDNLINLALVILVLFIFVKIVNRLREGQAVSLQGEPEKPEDIKLLEEIRDLLKQNQPKQNQSQNKKQK